jgi:membrane-bound lytic murein transglycosylase MltF
MNTDPSNYFNKQTLSKLRALEYMVYNWRNIFDIFASNPENRKLKYSISAPVLEGISKNLQDPAKFYKGSSDQVLADFGDVIKSECKYYNLDWRLVLGIIKQESAFSADAESHAGAFGFMQIMPKTGQTLEQTLNLEEHRSPVNNLKAGIYYYALLVGRYNDCGDTNKYRFALAAYNAGSGHVEDAMSIAYYFRRNYLDWNEVKEDMKLLAPGNDSLHRLVWSSRPPNGVFANWKEPYYYVENIMYYWDQYKKIYPLPEDNKYLKKKKKKK